MTNRSDPIVDVHCHIFTAAAKELVEANYPAEHIAANDPYEFYAGAGTAQANACLLPSLRPKMTNPAERLRDMDRMGIDVQVLAGFVSQYYYWTDGELGHQLARLQNDRLAEMVSSNPERFTAIGTVPLQDSRRSLEELDYLAGTLGFHGVQISSNVAGKDLDDPRFRPLFARAEELGMVVLIHPNGFSEGTRFRDHFMVNVVGNPMESTIALTRLIFSGVLADQADLKLCVVHGGGYLPTYHARMDHAWRVRPECRTRISEPPSTYLRRVYFDTMLFSPQILGHLIAFAGADHVMLGTDYPFDMGETDPVGFVDAVGLSPGDTATIRGRTAAALFGIT